MSDTLDLTHYVTAEGGKSHMEFVLEGVACAGCIRKIENGLIKVPGIIDARLNFTSKRLAVEWLDRDIEPAAVIREIERLGYVGHPFVPERRAEQGRRPDLQLLKCLAVAAFAAMNIMLLSVSVWSGADMGPDVRDFFHWLSALIALPAVAYAGQPFFASALRALRARSVNMDVPISVGVLLALAMSVVETASHGAHAYFDSAVMLLLFLLCGRYLDQLMRRKTQAVAGNLAALKAETAHRFEGESELATVPAAALKPGDRLLVRPGDRLPADGVVLSGRSELDESLVTGETARKPVAAGATIYAGSMNFSGALTMRVTANGAGTLLDEIERLLAKAASARSRYLQLADRAARLYAPVVHATAALTLVGWLAAGASLHDSIITAIAVLIITCPCAIALAVPAVQVVAAGTLFRSGVMLNRGDAVERLAEIDTVVFDKTGTLTLPELRVENAGDLDADLVAAAARLALSSHHPLAQALAREAPNQLPHEGAVEEHGLGVRAMIEGEEARLGSPKFCGIAASRVSPLQPDTSSIAFSHGNRSAVFVIRQKLRPDASGVIDGFKRLGLKLIILSGDQAGAVAPVADALGIRAWLAGLTPVEKIAKLDALKAQGRRILMVGDGLNDAPALAAAHVSLSPITAVALTQAQADAVFLGERLEPVLKAVAIARRARHLMQQNLWLAAAYNLIAVPIAVAGLVTPLIAAAAMSGSSLIVTLNALRAAQGYGRTTPQ
jgi:Cu2+-exporting ATPase